VWYVESVSEAKKEFLASMGMGWRAIIAALGTTAELVRSAKNLRETVSDLGDKREAPSPAPAEQSNEAVAALAAIHARIERVEAAEAKQAELLAKMADQDQALRYQFQHLAARVDKIFWIALVALILSSVLILRELIRLLF
jgi:predicted nuclease with TOPRIM domain